MYSKLVALSGALLLSGALFAPESVIQRMPLPASATFMRVRAALSAEAPVVPAKPLPPRVEHQPMPEQVKAVYMSQCAASSQSFRDELFALARTTEINSIIVDLKDYSGTVAFPSETAIPDGKGCTVDDFRDLVKAMHAENIYVIGRMTVFQDPLYTKVHPDQAVQRKGGGIWRDNKGLAFVDVGATEYWDHVVKLSREAHALGVDEINFDYIRFPSDGPMSEAVYSRTAAPKPEQVEKFFKYLHEKVKVEQDQHMPIMSADLFGMTTTNLDDLSIGQVLERAMPYFDYIAPMVYPSHYPPRFNGWANPNDHVYGVVNFSMEHAVRRTVATTTPIASFAYERIGTSTPAVYKKPSYPATMMRPWLQDFDYGGDYGPKEVRDQIQATYDAGLNSWMLWAPSNHYTKAGLLPE